MSWVSSNFGIEIATKYTLYDHGFVLVSQNYTYVDVFSKSAATILKIQKPFEETHITLISFMQIST